MDQLKNQAILVTGASKGIGKAIAEHLLTNGSRVGIHYNSDRASAEALLNNTKNDSAIFSANLESEEDTVKLFESVRDHFEKIDTIVINAGVFLEHSIDLSTEQWLQTWHKTMAINLTSAGILTKLGLDHFKRQGGGRFIYIGSRAVFCGETEEYLAYAASKGGLTSLARSVARSFGKQNIKSFIVSPGFTRTQMAEQFVNAYGEERILSEIALNQLTTPEDLAPLVGLMCSGQMDHATGATIDVNAGSHIR